MREKLIELMMVGEEKGKIRLQEMLGEPVPKWTAVGWIADHLLANGVIVQPCKVGDTVWCDTWKGGKNIGIQPHKIEDVRVVATAGRVFGGVGATFYDWEFGKTVFLTREEAVAELKEAEG